MKDFKRVYENYVRFVRGRAENVSKSEERKSKLWKKINKEFKLDLT